MAWNEASNPEEIHTIRDWPGASSANPKVPTKISFTQNGEVDSWGFLCKDEHDSFHTKELFKVFLDSTQFNSSELKKFSQQRPENPTEVVSWAYCFLRSLIGHAIDYIGNVLQKTIENAGIEMQLLIHCNLSIPTTWDVNTITNFGFLAERAICDAIDARKTYDVSVKTIKANITEPEAVGNYILHEKKMTSLRHGDRFLVLDVGGSTSDLCLCQVAEVYGHHICVVSDRKAPIRGINSGCVDIDNTFQLRVMERLRTARISNTFDLAMQMRKSQEFQQYKTFYHRGEIYGTKFTIPGLSVATTVQQLQIFKGQMVL